MARIARIGLLVVGLIVLLVVGLILLVSSRDTVSAGNLSRGVEPRLFWGGGDAAVTLTYAPPADLVCPPARRAANVILLLDKSESMLGGDAFPAALAAAEAFIDTLDLSTSRVGVVFFDEEAQLASAPIQDKDHLRAALSGFAPGGRTDIAGALAAAEAQLAGLAGQVAELPAIVVLLTDGAANDMPAAAAAAERLKGADIRLVTVGVGLAEAGFLRELASSPNDYVEVSQATELADVYTRLADQLNTAVAFDAQLVEPVAEALTVDAGSLTPAGALADNTITWAAASLPAEGAAFAYRADVGGLGLRNVNSGDAVMSYSDCIAGAVRAALTAGPQVLVMPPAWLALLLLLVSVLPLLFMAFFRRSKSQQPPSPVAAPTPTLPDPVDLTPAWLTRLDESKSLFEGAAAAEQGKLAPTLIVGVGPVGRIVIPQIAQALRGRYGVSWPADVRLLQIDVEPKGGAEQSPGRPEYLSPDQYVVLEPDLNEVTRNLQRSPDRYPYLKWYQEAAPGYERARGRMAVFYDLQHGAAQSRLWHALSDATAKLDKPKIRLVGSTFDDAGSGMLVDLARLTQLISRTDVDVELWLTLPFAQDWSSRLNNPRQKLRPAEQTARTLATLRELERFQRNAVVPFNYVSPDHQQDELHRDARMAVVQTLFLFEPATDNVEEHLATLTDSLLAVLPVESQQAVSQYLANTRRRANTLINEEGLGMVSSLGAYAVRLPSQMLEEALAWRMVHDLLYDTRVGLLPAARLLADGGYEPVALADFQESPEELASLREAADKFVAAFQGRTGGEIFRNHAARRVADILNGETGDEPTLARAGGLLRALSWIGAVRAVLLRSGHLEAGQSLTALEATLEEWRDFLIDQTRPRVTDRMSRSRAALESLKSESGRQWVLSEGLEWGAYQERIRPWTTGQPSSNTAGEPLLRAARRFGWYVEYNETGRRWHVQLLAPPAAYTWRDEAVNYDEMAVDQAPDAFAATLHNLIQAAAYGDSGPQRVFDEAEVLDAARWVDRAAPRLSYNTQAAGEEIGGGGQGDLLLLVAPDVKTRAEKIQGKLIGGASGQAVTLVEVKDDTAITLVRVRDRVPLYTLNHYGQEAWERQAVLPGLYVWRGEQLAADVELDGAPLGPVFVGWLERDPELLERFGRAYLFDLYRQSGDSAYLPGLEFWPGENVGQALDNLMGGDQALRPVALARGRERQNALRSLDEQIEARQAALWQSPGKASALQDAERRLLASLRGSRDGRETDFARYLAALINRL